MDALIQLAIRDWAGLISYLLLFALILSFIVLPVSIIVWLGKLLSKDRYTFAQTEHLYRLDTLTGKIHVARGIGWFQEMKITDNAEEKKENK